MALINKPTHIYLSAQTYIRVGFLFVSVDGFCSLF